MAPPNRPVFWIASLMKEKSRERCAFMATAPRLIARDQDNMHESRTAQRFPIEQPVRVTLTRAGHYELEAVTKDVSAEGVFVYVESEIVEGSEVELRLSLPAESGSVPARVRGRVIRVEKASVGSKHGVGIAFEKVEILPGVVKTSG
jgi:hypothetical protein